MKKTIISPYEQQLIEAHILGMSREYVLTHPEVALNKAQEAKLGRFLARRKNNEPLAYILGHKEFYGLDFKVTLNTLIPRPETELLVEIALKKIEEERGRNKKISIMDVGTGSGNIIISIASNTKIKKQNAIKFYATDISGKALRVAKCNAKKNRVDKKIKFIQADLLDVFIKNDKYKISDTNLIIAANLPYLSREIYSSAMIDVKDFEPKIALYSKKEGLAYYEKLLSQIKKLKRNYHFLRVSCFLEFSPEQKTKIKKLIENNFPASLVKFQKDLAGKWRVVGFELSFRPPRSL